MVVKRVAVEAFRASLPREDDPDCVHTWLYRSVHRVVNAPASSMFPAWPVTGWEMGYWEGAIYFLQCMLGWSKLDLGLLRLERLGFLGGGERPDPAKFPLLALLSELWDDAGQLDLLAAWVFTHAWPCDIAFTGLGDSSLIPGASLPLSPPSRWHQKFEAKYQGRFPAYSPYDGFNPNGLHLGSSNGDLGEGDEAGRLLVGDPESLEAILLPGSGGWYWALCKRADAVGALGFRVDVVVPGFGWLGRFRRSPVTGLWYRGTHDEHLLGNLHPKAQRPEDWRIGEERRFATGQAIAFMIGREIMPATGREPAFAFRPGEVRVNDKGKKRTILGCGFDKKQEPIYVVRRHDSGEVETKNAQRAHVGYGPLLDFDPACVAELAPSDH